MTENFRDTGLERTQIIREWVEGKREIVTIIDRKGDRDISEATLIIPATMGVDCIDALDNPKLYTTLKQVRRDLRAGSISPDRARLIRSQLYGGTFVINTRERSWRGYRSKTAWMPRV